MRQHCGLTSIRCHFEWRHPPSSFPFSQTHTHTFVPPPPSDDLLLWHCAADALALARPFSSGWKGRGGGVTGLRMGGGGGRRRLRGKAHTFLSRIMLLPPLEEKWPCNLALHIQDGCIFSLFWGGWGSKEKRKGASFKCNKQHYCETYPEERWYMIVYHFR